MYYIIDDYTTGKPFVYVFSLTFNLSDFDLIVPPSLKTNHQTNGSNEGVIRLNESDIRAIIQETLKRLLWN